MPLAHPWCGALVLISEFLTQKCSPHNWPHGQTSLSITGHKFSLWSLRTPVLSGVCCVLEVIWLQVTEIHIHIHTQRRGGHYGLSNWEIQTQWWLDPGIQTWLMAIFSLSHCSAPLHASFILRHSFLYSSNSMVIFPKPGIPSRKKLPLS